MGFLWLTVGNNVLIPPIVEPLEPLGGKWTLSLSGHLFRLFF